jgi:hypothetical protein
LIQHRQLKANDMQNAYENANDDAGNGASAEAVANIDVALWIVRQQVLETTIISYQQHQQQQQQRCTMQGMLGLAHSSSSALTMP